MFEMKKTVMAAKQDRKIWHQKKMAVPPSLFFYYLNYLASLYSLLHHSG